LSAAFVVGIFGLLETIRVAARSIRAKVSEELPESDCVRRFSRNSVRDELRGETLAPGELLLLAGTGGGSFLLVREWDDWTGDPGADSMIFVLVSGCGTAAGASKGMPKRNFSLKADSALVIAPWCRFRMSAIESIFGLALIGVTGSTRKMVDALEMMELLGKTELAAIRFVAAWRSCSFFCISSCDRLRVRCGTSASIQE